MLNFNKKRKNKGFTLIEAIISSAVSLGILTLISGSLLFFNNTSNQVRIKNNLQADLRNASNRIQKEVLPGRLVLSSYNGEASTENKLILSVPTYDSNGYPSSTNGKDFQNNDILKLERVENKLKLTLVPAAGGSSRKSLTNQVLLSGMINPNPVANGSSEKLFSYFSDKNEPLSGSNVEKAALIRVTLWTAKENGANKFIQKEELNIRLRNSGR